MSNRNEQQPSQTTAIAKKQPGFLQMLQDPKLKDQIAAALPKHMTPERMIRVALTAWRKTSALQKCEPLSVISAIVQASQLGLEPDGVLGHAYLVPYGNQCQLIPGYRGLIDLARRSGHVVSIQAHVVYERDKFDFAYGLDERLSHTPCMDGDRGRAVAVYAVAKLKDGGYALEVMSMADVEKIRKRSKAANNGPWVTDFDEMAKKTAVRRMVKYLPLSVELHKAVAIDERAEAGMDYESVIDVTAGLEDITESADPNRGHHATEPPASGETAQQHPAETSNPEPDSYASWSEAREANGGDELSPTLGTRCQVGGNFFTRPNSTAKSWTREIPATAPPAPPVTREPKTYGIDAPLPDAFDVRVGTEAYYVEGRVRKLVRVVEETIPGQGMVAEWRTISEEPAESQSEPQAEPPSTAGQAAGPRKPPVFGKGKQQ